MPPTTRKRRPRGSILHGIVRLLGRNRPGLLGGLVLVAVVAALLLLVSGFIRGGAADALAADWLAWLEQALREQLDRVIVEPAVVTAVLLALKSALFGLALLLLAGYVRNVPCYVGFLVLSEFQRRHGDKFAALKLLLGISMPLALAACLLCHGTASLYAWFHFVAGLAWIRFTNDPVALDQTLRFYARLRFGLDNPVEDDGPHDDADPDA